MITVAVYINNVPIICRQARRVQGEPGEMCRYKVDDGNFILHHYDDGAAKLAIQNVDGVRESGFIEACNLILDKLKEMEG